MSPHSFLWASTGHSPRHPPSSSRPGPAQTWCTHARSHAPGAWALLSTVDCAVPSRPACPAGTSHDRLGTDSPVLPLRGRTPWTSPASLPRAAPGAKAPLADSAQPPQPACQGPALTEGLASAFCLQASALHLSGCTREPPACSRVFLAPPLALPPAHSSVREWTGLLLTTYPAGLPPRTKDRLCPFLPQVPSHNSRERSELKTRQVVRTSSAPDLSDPRPPPWRLGN